MTGTPRSQVAARNPAASPSAPPPTATSGSRRSARRRASSRAAASTTAIRFASSPWGSMTRSTAKPSAASAPASASPAAAHAPGSETRIARLDLGPPQRRRDLGRRDPFAEDEMARDGVRPQRHRLLQRRRACRRELVDAFDEGRHLGCAVQPLGRRVEARPVAAQLPDRPDRIAALDERPDVRAAAESLGEDLRPAVEPDRQAAPVQRPAIARVDDGAAAGRDHPPDRWLRVGPAKAIDRGPLHGPERRLAVVLEDLRDPPAVGVLDRLVEVDELGAVAVGEPPPDGGLAAPRQPDEDDVHLSRPRQSSPPEPDSTSTDAPAAPPRSPAAPRCEPGTARGCPSSRRASRRRTCRA